MRALAPATGRLPLLADLRYSVLFGDFDQTATSIADNVLVADRTYTTDDSSRSAKSSWGRSTLLPRGRFEIFLDAAPS